MAKRWRLGQRGRWLAGLGLLLGTLAGCCSDCGKGPWLFGNLRGGCAACGDKNGLFKDKCAEIPLGAIPPPAGTHLAEIKNAQKALAEADDFVIYEHEWLYGGTVPGPYGRYHLGQIAKRLADVPFPVLIQVNPDENLNQVRRAAVVAFLVNNGYADADTRVVVGFPAAEGLFGDEAARDFERGYSGGYGAFGVGYNPYVGSRLGLGGFGGGLGGFGGGLGGGFFRR
jgi:hypothetical protein